MGMAIVWPDEVDTSFGVTEVYPVWVGHAARIPVVSVDYRIDVPPAFGWYRALERAQPPAKLLTRCATAAQRIWRRLHGHDALQARRQKRRRFVQLLATA